MAAPCICIRNSAGFTIIVFLVLLVSSSFLASADSGRVIGGGTRVASWSRDELLRLQRIEAQLARVWNVSVKTIQSPDGDVIDCVPTHLQPAFEHPMLRGLKPEGEPIERPRDSVDHGNGDGDAGEEQGLPQVWTRSGESCPEGTIPVRRTTASDLRRASSAQRFGMKARGSTDSIGFAHEHSVAAVSDGAFYGAKASLNVWPAQVAATPGEFSLAQIWVMAGIQGVDLNTVEAGWQVSPLMYGDTSPRFFIYWTRDAYKTGCYNLLCSGFVQTSNQVAIGGAVSGVSSYNGPQFDLTVFIWKDLERGNWWLQAGGEAVGYWPSALFTHLAARADTVHFGGEVAAAPRPRGAPHTRTQMGSDQFACAGYGRAAYVRNAQLVAGSEADRLVPAAGLRFRADRPGCYNIVRGRSGGAWGTYFYYGGPGRNVLCR